MEEFDLDHNLFNIGVFNIGVQLSSRAMKTFAFTCVNFKGRVKVGLDKHGDMIMILIVLSFMLVVCEN